MKLNHINLPVPDVAATRAFFETYFDLHCIVDKGPDTFIGLSDGAEMALALSDFDKGTEIVYPKWFHIGFMQDTDAQVDEVHQRLTAGGIQADKPKHEHGAWTFYFTAPGGFTVEVSHQHRGE